MDKLSVRVTLIQGTGLVAKDRNLLGKKTSSDPYVECFSTYQKPDNSGRLKTFGKKIGQTEVIKKTLEPKYNHTFDPIEFAYASNPNIQLRIFDYDKLSDPDSMGVVNIPLHNLQGSSGDTTHWYDVPKDSAKNASGKLQVRIRYTVHKLVQYVTQSKKKVNSMFTADSKKKSSKTSGSKTPPKRFIRVDGVMKLNPEYMKWKETHG